MARTTAAAVKAVLLPGKDYDTENSPDLTPFIDTASAYVDDIVTCAADQDPAVTLTDARLELIERWLAAHFYVVSDQTYASKSTEGASASFHGQTGMYIESSRYGQTAMSLDKSGCLASIGGSAGRIRVGTAWLGKAPSNQTDYVDRD